MHSEKSRTSLHVAIVGGGITGLTLAIGLQARNIDFTIYERAASFREIGAGIGFSPNAERAMRGLDVRIHESFKKVATPNGEDYFQWIDGYKSDELIYKLYLGKDCFNGCRRVDILEEWVRLIPPEKVKYNKQIENLSENQNGKVVLRFIDGTREEADAVVGCDGIRSRVRQLLMSEDNPAAHPSYTNKVSFRALIPMDKAREALGHQRTSTRFMYNGPGAHVITYPVSMGDVLNVLIVLSDENHWSTKDGRHTDSGSKSDATAAFEGWHPTVQAIVELLPDNLDKWAVFDMYDNPAPAYSQGLVCVAGDAAHAVGPHLGAGAGFGLEDALVLSYLLEVAQARTSQGRDKADLIQRALEVYSDIRLVRTQWLMRATREAVDLFQWRDPDIGENPERFGREITELFHEIWNIDTDGMIQESLNRFHLNTAGNLSSNL